MDIALKKLELLDWIMHLEDTAMFKRLIAMKEETEEDHIVAYSSAGEPLDSNAYGLHVEEGLKDAKEGRVTPHEDFLNEAKSW